MLAGGIPTRTSKHADNVTDMALKMLEIIKSIPNPAAIEPNKHLEIRTGMLISNASWKTFKGMCT